MKKLLIFFTISLLSELSFQLTMKKPLTRFHCLRKGGCGENRKPIFRNSTNCTEGRVLSCSSSKLGFSNKTTTWCYCKKKIIAKPRNITITPKCPVGAFLRCTKSGCKCRDIPSPIIKPQIELKCPDGTELRCKGSIMTKESCDCRKLKKILPLEPKRHKK